MGFKNSFEEENIKLDNEMYSREKGVIILPDDISYFPVGLIHGHHSQGKEDDFHKNLNEEIIKNLKNTSIYSVFTYNRVKIISIDIFNVSGFLGIKGECHVEGTGETIKFEESYGISYKNYLGFKIKDSNELLVIRLRDKTFEIGSESFAKWYSKEPYENTLLYIGRSKNMIKRLKKHEKINEIFSYLNTNDIKKKILIGAFNIKICSTIDIEDISIKEGMNPISYSKGIGKDIICLFEAFWISNLKPKYNIQNIGDYNKDSPEFKETLKILHGTGFPIYSYYTFLCKMNSPYGEHIDGIKFNSDGINNKYYEIKKILV